MGSNGFYSKLATLLAALPQQWQVAFMFAALAHHLWGGTRCQVRQNSVFGYLNPANTRACVQPIGESGVIGDGGVYGTLTTCSLAQVFCKMVELGLTTDDVLCDIGAGLGG